MVHLIEQDFGTFKGEPIKKFTWKSKSGISVSVISYGAIVQAIEVPDKHGEVNDVVLGFDDIDGYVNRNTPYLGATVGRCANRIGGASFQIDGATYDLAKNVGGDHLHGGIVGFDKANWKSVVNENQVIFSYLSKDGEEGYPGDLVTSVIYELKDDKLYVEFVATTTKKTVVNLTNHSYFNLAGHDAGSTELYNHVIAINADRITETTSESIPTGKFLNVGGTAYDLRIPQRLGDLMSKTTYDDNYCVSTHGNEQLHVEQGSYLKSLLLPGTKMVTSYKVIFHTHPSTQMQWLHARNKSVDTSPVELYIFYHMRFVKKTWFPAYLFYAIILCVLGNLLPISYSENADSTQVDYRLACTAYSIFHPQNLNFVSRVEHPPTGRYMEVYSDQPGVQLYTSNFLPSPGDPALIGKGGSGYRLHGAFCLETQKFPDAVHHPNFPTTILKPGEVYRHRVSYAFGVVDSEKPAVIVS